VHTALVSLVEGNLPYSTDTHPAQPLDNVCRLANQLPNRASRKTLSDNEYNYAYLYTLVTYNYRNQTTFCDVKPGCCASIGERNREKQVVAMLYQSCTQIVHTRLARDDGSSFSNAITCVA